MNETLKTIAARFSCRDFTNREISDNDLAAIAEAGVQAPSGMNRMHFQIIMIKNRALIEELEAEGMRVMADFEDKSMYQRIMSRGGKLFYNAPYMAFIAIKEAFPKGAELIDLGIVAQNISLAATSLGIDSCHCGMVAFCFAGTKAQELKTKLKFPEGYECGMAVLLGHAVEQKQPHNPDKTKITFID